MVLFHERNFPGWVCIYPKLSIYLLFLDEAKRADSRPPLGRKPKVREPPALLLGLGHSDLEHCCYHSLSHGEDFKTTRVNTTSSKDKIYLFITC